MISFVIQTLPGTAMPSWRLADGPLAAQAGNARKRIAPAGAPAYAHVVCAAQHTSLVMEQNSALMAVSADAAEPFGTQVQTQLSVDATRVEGRAGSPPRGEPV